MNFFQYLVFRLGLLPLFKSEFSCKTFHLTDEFNLHDNERPGEKFHTKNHFCHSVGTEPKGNSELK